MKNNVMSFKAIINNIAKENKISAQSVLQTYMLERLLERISLSQYKDNFILKGGMLISAILGIDSRTTMDMDTTIKGFELNEENITKIYMDKLPVIMKIDITTGDKITYREIKYNFELMLEKRKIQVWSYNVETIIAEKFEAIIKRGALGTRIRDFYDIHMLLKTQSKNINPKILKDAIYSTAEHRNSLNDMKNWKNIVEVLSNDSNMQLQWKRYQKNNFYAEEIEYKDLMDSLIEVGKILDIELL